MNIFFLQRDAPTTVDVTYSLLLLPEEKMTPRLSDARVGIFNSVKYDINSAADRARNAISPTAGASSQEVGRLRRRPPRRTQATHCFLRRSQLPRHVATAHPRRCVALEQGFRKDRLQERRAGARLPHREGRSAVRSRQPCLLLHPLRPQLGRECHGPLVG